MPNTLFQNLHPKRPEKKQGYHIMLTPTTKAAAETAAKEKKQSLSAYTERALVEYIKKDDSNDNHL
ncbi:hypothetical protein JK159_05415 [Weissella minor]|uniref:hypothetical protein n=1 Tax=Weissella minor TaxID=1620 RepID=UPI001BB080ED|nr:hypothetical protein [Weissella minor]MBS0949805.1 hypothetical protein [Weissella minor]